MAQLQARMANALRAERRSRLLVFITAGATEQQVLARAVELGELTEDGLYRPLSGERLETKLIRQRHAILRQIHTAACCETCASRSLPQTGRHPHWCYVERIALDQLLLRPQEVAISGLHQRVSLIAGTMKLPKQVAAVGQYTQHHSTLGPAVEERTITIPILPGSRQF